MKVDQYHLSHNPEAFRRYQKDMCMLVFSYDRHLPWLKACLKSIREFDLFTALAWDRGHLPPQDVITPYTETVCIKPLTQSNVVQSWMWHSIGTLWLADHFDYIFSVSGDCYFSKPENLPKIREKMGDYDILSYWYNHNKIGTMGWICKSQAYKAIIEDVLLEWNNPAQPGGMAEARVHFSSIKLGYKVAPTMGPMFDFKLPPQGDTIEKRGIGWFAETLGMRHLHWESLRRKALDLPPLEKELLS